jgi:hypothetical protein
LVSTQSFSAVVSYVEDLLAKAEVAAQFPRAHS